VGRTKIRPRTRAQAKESPADIYPRPLLRRPAWWSLDGKWQFALDREATIDSPRYVKWNSSILVPFAPESPASGVGESGYFRRSWYRRMFRAPALPDGERLILHFGAVDYLARVWVNEKLAVEHEGGYTPFSTDITDLLSTGEQELVVRADDDPHDLAKPRGKQDWHLHPHSIWYPRTSGIWQTVWLEVVPPVRFTRLRWTPKVEDGEIRLIARIEGSSPEQYRVAVTLSHEGQVLCDDLCSIELNGEVRRVFPVAASGAEDFAIDLLWTPEYPRLIDVSLRLLTKSGEVVDEVKSYTALRSLGIDGDRFLFNRRPRTLRLVLNQGYWPEGGMTPPDDDAYRDDVELIKKLGFDGVRLHQKIESPRFLYWADKLGLLVWEEMPSSYIFSADSVRRSISQWTEVIERDVSHPSIVAWVPVNESWGAPDLPCSSQQRAFVRAMYDLTKALDSTRPVIGNDGWEIDVSDITTIHDYDHDPERLAKRYHVATEAELIENLKCERPGHRRIILEDYRPNDRPVMLTEFGGIAYGDCGGWGYSSVTSKKDYIERYTRLLAIVRSIKKLSGWCYTQFTDTYQEANGLCDMNRRPKADVDVLQRATTGP
jgi:beta-galactosidase/beta-glucuronidase